MISPGDRNTLIDKARALTELGEYEKALINLDMAIDQTPKDIELLNEKKDVLKRLRRHDAVITTSDRILSLDHRNIDAFYDKASALFALEKYGRAVDSLLCSSSDQASSQMRGQYTGTRSSVFFVCRLDRKPSR